MFRYKSISVTCLLVTILFGHVEQQLIILSCSIEKYQEIGPWTLWLAWVVVLVSILVDFSKFPLVKSKLDMLNKSYSVY